MKVLIAVDGSDCADKAFDCEWTLHYCTACNFYSHTKKCFWKHTLFTCQQSSAATDIFVGKKNDCNLLLFRVGAMIVTSCLIRIFGDGS